MGNLLLLVEAVSFGLRTAYHGPRGRRTRPLPGRQLRGAHTCPLHARVCRSVAVAVIRLLLELAPLVAFRAVEKRVRRDLAVISEIVTDLVRLPFFVLVP